MTKVRSTAALATAMCVSALALAACGSSSTATGASSAGSQSKTNASSLQYKILAILPESGPVASFGDASVAALKAGVDEANSIAGGPHLSITFEDDAGDPTQSVSKFQTAIASGSTNYNAVFLFTSESATAVVPLAAKYPLLIGSLASTAALNSREKYPHFVGMAASTSTVENLMLQKLKSEGYHNIGSIYSTDAYGEEAQTSLEAAAKQLGLTLTGTGIANPTNNALSVVQKALNSKPQAVVMAISTNGGAAGSVLQARATLGAQGTPFYADMTTAAFPVAATTVPQDWKNVTMQYQAFAVAGAPLTKTPQMVTFRQRLAKYAKSPLETGLPVYVHSYDFPLAISAAVKKAGATSVDSVLAALRTFKDGAEIPGFVAQTPLWTDPTTNNPAHTIKDFIFSPLGPIVNGLATSPTK